MRSVSRMMNANTSNYIRSVVGWATNLFLHALHFELDWIHDEQNWLRRKCWVQNLKNMEVAWPKKVKKETVENVELHTSYKLFLLIMLLKDTYSLEEGRSLSLKECLIFDCQLGRLCVMGVLSVLWINLLASPTCCIELISTTVPPRYHEISWLHRYFAIGQSTKLYMSSGMRTLYDLCLHATHCNSQSR